MANIGILKVAPPNFFPKSNLERLGMIFLSSLLLFVSIYAAVKTKSDYLSAEELRIIKTTITGIVGILVFFVPSLFFILWQWWHILIRLLGSLLISAIFYFLTPNSPPDPTIKLSLTSTNPIIDFRTSLAPLQNAKTATKLQLKESNRQRDEARSVIILSLQYVSMIDGTRRAIVQNEELSILFNNGELKYYGSYTTNVTNNSRWLESKENLVARKIGFDSILKSEILFYPVDKKTTWAELKQRLDLYREDTLTIKVTSDINGRKEVLLCEVDMSDFKKRSFIDGLTVYPSKTLQPACI